jgi:hypothetical protein
MDTNEFGLTVTKATELTKGLKSVLTEREFLIQEFTDISSIEVTEENIPIFKELRGKIVKNRTQGISKWHTANKQFFLTGGRFVDAIKNKEILINQQMEEKLANAENHFINLERDKRLAIQTKRVKMLLEYNPLCAELDLATMDEEIWESYFNVQKRKHLAFIESERKIEEEKQEVLENERLENIRIQKENQRLVAENKEILAKAKLEAQEKDALLEAERLKMQEVQRKEAQLVGKRNQEILAKAKLEAQEKADAEAKIEFELNKGDALKINDLITDLQNLKSKYSFKSKKNKIVYKSVSVLIDKVITFIITN